MCLGESVTCSPTHMRGVNAARSQRSGHSRTVSASSDPAFSQLCGLQQLHFYSKTLHYIVSYKYYSSRAPPLRRLVF